jgi:hypothetical protein
MAPSESIELVVSLILERDFYTLGNGKFQVSPIENYSFYLLIISQTLYTTA